MARIDYLIQNPKKVEYTDLELLNTEILKYPYFYSLRALKLLALKKGNDSTFDDTLKLTSVYSQNRKELFNYIHQQDSLSENIGNDSKQEEILESNENQSAIKISSEDSIINTIDNQDIHEDLNNPIDEKLIEDDVLEQLQDTSELDENVEEIKSDDLDKDLVKTVDELQIENTVLNQSQEVSETSVDNSELVNNFEINESEDLEKDLVNLKNDESIIEQEVLINLPDKEVENSTIIEEVNSVQLNEFTFNEPTIESIIEEFKQHDFSIPETTNSLVEFDLPSTEFKEILDQSIENSISIANQFVNQNSEPDNKVENFEVIEEKENSNKIEQVSLVNRADNYNEEKKIQENLKPVSSINHFQIINTKNEIKGGFGFNENQESLIEIENPEFIEPETSPVKKEILGSPIEDSTITEDRYIEKNISIEENDSRSDIEIENKSSEDSLSFNDWLKLPQFESDIKPEKDFKYQIIDDFLEKNPKITPIKKQEIPESKNQIKEVKQTDFSDLMTETLAQIYIEQKQYEKAIRAYKILSLKYPEKNSLFAKQIKEIEILKNSK